MAGVTVKDIAARLGVSPSAVSLALNGKPGVSEATRDRIVKAAQSMGYARGDAIGPKSNPVICFVRYAGETVSIAEHTSFSSFVLQGVEACATELGYSTQVRYLNAGDLGNPGHVESFSGAAGILLLGTDLVEEQLPELEQFFSALDRTPIVTIDSFLLADRVDCVGNDSFGGAKSAANHLLKTGHRRIGYVRSKQRIRILQEREQGVRSALQEAGLSLNVIVDAEISSEGAFQDFENWMKTKPTLPEAFFAENDIMAAAVIRVLKKHGYRVPEDVSVIGFDDVPVCEMLDPPLSTVHVFKQELGTVAMEHLHRRITHGEVPHRSASLGLLRTTLSTRLVIRDSVRMG